MDDVDTDRRTTTAAMLVHFKFADRDLTLGEVVEDLAALELLLIIALEKSQQVRRRRIKSLRGKESRFAVPGRYEATLTVSRGRYVLTGGSAQVRRQQRELIAQDLVVMRLSKSSPVETVIAITTGFSAAATAAAFGVHRILGVMERMQRYRKLKAETTAEVARIEAEAVRVAKEQGLDGSPAEFAQIARVLARLEEVRILEGDAPAS